VKVRSGFAGWLLMLWLLPVSWVVAAERSAPNFLLVIADDLGVDVLGSYGHASKAPKTPHLDQLAAVGLSFDHFWVTPACTTTRGALISGQHGFESGIDFVPAVMPDATATLQQRLKQPDIEQPYATGVFGKWHLGGGRPDTNHPARFGIDSYAGNLFNLDNYTDWTLTVNGRQQPETAYHTSKVTDLAIDFIAQHQGKPWFAWVAYSAPHKPFHQPPAELISSSKKMRRPAEKYRAMVEAMDTEIGRLLASLSEQERANTLVVFIGDNGTPKVARERSLFAKDHVKGTLYEGGIRAPLIVAGAGVSRKGQREQAMVNAADIFATFTEAATGVTNASGIPDNSYSFLPLLRGEKSAVRTFNYSEWRKRNESLSWTLRDDSYKLIRHADGRTELFAVDDLSETDPLEKPEVESELMKLSEQLRQTQ